MIEIIFAGAFQASVVISTRLTVKVQSKGFNQLVPPNQAWTREMFERTLCDNSAGRDSALTEPSRGERCVEGAEMKQRLRIEFSELGTSVQNVSERGYWDVPACACPKKVRIRNAHRYIQKLLALFGRSYLFTKLTERHHKCQ